MKTIPFLATLGLLYTFTGPAFGDVIDELNMGLSKTSVFDTPTPTPAAYSDAKPGKNAWLPRAWDGIPPQIPHRTAIYLPVVAAESGADDLLLRPLCARNLPPTRPEREGWVAREQLKDFSGRSRKPQIALAAEFGFEDYAQPAGGCCFLTDKSY